MLERLLDYERDWFFAINSSHTWWLDYIMLAFASMWAWFPLFIVPLWFFLKRREEWLLILGCSFLTVVVNLMVTSLFFKPFFMRYRPVHHPSFKDSVTIVKDYIESGSYGFISGHSTNAFAFAVMSVLIVRNKWYSLAIFLWAIIMVYSRVYLGVHFISDVVPGMMVGAIIGWLLYLLYKFVQNKKDRPLIKV